MKLLALLLAALALSVSEGELISNAFENGASKVAAPVLPEVILDGETLRNDTIYDISHYLQGLDTELSRLHAWGTREILQPCSLRFREIVDLQVIVEVGAATDDFFDYQLWYLANSFLYVVDLVKQGEVRMAQKLPLKSETLLKELTQKLGSLPAPERGMQRYSLEQLFYGLSEEVLQPDLKILREWLLATFDAGRETVLASADEIEDGYRQQYLWPMVQSLQDDAHSVEKYDASLEKYSTPMYWEMYDKARNDLWALVRH